MEFGFAVKDIKSTVTLVLPILVNSSTAVFQV